MEIIVISYMILRSIALEKLYLKFGFRRVDIIQRLLCY